MLDIATKHREIGDRRAERQRGSRRIAAIYAVIAGFNRTFGSPAVGGSWPSRPLMPVKTTQNAATGAAATSCPGTAKRPHGGPSRTSRKPSAPPTPEPVAVLSRVADGCPAPLERSGALGSTFHECRRLQAAALSFPGPPCRRTTRSTNALIPPWPEYAMTLIAAYS